MNPLEPISPIWQVIAWIVCVCGVLGIGWRANDW